jgi:SagB-type dehydrogenase family enzyme
MALPRHILERVERLYSYHQRSKIMPMGARFEPPADAAFKPAPFRIFANAPKIALPTTLLDAPIGMLTLLRAGQDALPDSLRAPPQDLKTLASWLYYAAGETRRAAGRAVSWNRPFADAEATLPVEVYVAAFGIKDIEPGLYHFSPREFSLRRLREGVSTLLQIKKGRPDLEFLKTLPAVIFVAGSYWPAVYRFGRRGYRTMLLDAGQMVQNLVIAGAGLGVQTITRLRLSDSNMRELIGCASDEALGTAESVFAMVAWADRAVSPLQLPPRGTAGTLPLLVRAQLSEKVADDSASAEPLSMHHDCIAPGVAVRELRPPLTELSPLPANFPVSNVRVTGEPPSGLPVRQVLLDRKPKCRLMRLPINRPDLLSINRIAFRGGSCFPMFPDGPQVACVRPFWIVQEVAGMDKGIWYYHPPADTWSVLNQGQYRREVKYIAGDREAFGDASAVCIMIANLHVLMTQGGPDAYRLAHLEAGLAGQRLYLAATSLNVACLASQDFYDEECRTFLGLSKTGWEVLSVVALGKPADPKAAAAEERARALGQTAMWNG